MNRIFCSQTLTDIRGIIATGQWVLTFLTLGPLCLMASIYVLLFTKWWFLSIGYGIYYLIDRQSPAQGGKQINFLRNWRVWRYMAEYFPLKLIVNREELDEDQNYLVCYHPHGVLNVGGFLNFAVNGSGINKLLPGFKTYLTALSGHFDFPLYRDYLLRSGLVSVAKDSIVYILTGPRRRGNLVTVVMGGALEALDAHPNKNRIHIYKKHGIFKIALETGTSIIPCYSFGENNCYYQVDNQPGSLFRKFQNTLTKYCGFSPPIFYGRGFIPLRRPITTIFGKPLKVHQIKNPTIDDIEKLRKEYIERLSELFYQNKSKYAADEDDIEFF